MLDDPRLSSRVARFLAARAERWARTPVARILSLTHAEGPEGPFGVIPDDLLVAAVAFEERYGGLSYRPRPGENHMEYGLDGAVYFRWTPEFGWAMAAGVDGSWTWVVDLLLDGRTIMAPGSWPARVIDRSLEQRLEKHALLAEVSAWPHATFAHQTDPHVPPAIGMRGLPMVREATGDADLWWHDGEAAVHLALNAWPEGQDHWVLRCFARRHDDLPRVLGLVTTQGEIDRWCSICCRFLQPGLPAYTAQGGPGLCLPTESSADGSS